MNADKYCDTCGWALCYCTPEWSAVLGALDRAAAAGDIIQHTAACAMRELLAERNEIEKERGRVQGRLVDAVETLRKVKAMTTMRLRKLDIASQRSKSLVRAWLLRERGLLRNGKP